MSEMLLVRPNARHHPPRSHQIKHGVLRMRSALFAVGCMPLLGFALGQNRSAFSEPIDSKDNKNAPGNQAVNRQ